MLTHLHPSSTPPARVVILGAGGFVGGSTLRHLKAHQNQTLALGRPGLDLLAPDAATKLATALRPDDALVFVSALAPCKNATMLLDNLRMAEVVSTALAQSPVAHAVYVSSDAVYADSPHPLAESSCAEPGSIHGVMHLAREVVMKSITTIPLAIVRPTLVYGLDDPHNGYGPNRFRRLAANGETIKLFGEGEERRDHVAVEDVAELIRLLLGRRSTGAVNATSGAVVSFRELAETAIAAFSSGSKIVGSPRSGLMPHNGYRPFAPSAALLAFPGFAFRSWQDGYAANCAATPSA